MAKKNTESGAGKFLGGALIGSVLGVAAALLLAPESGKEMQQDIKKRAGEFYKYLAPKAKKLKKMGEQEYRDFLAQATESYAKSKKLSLEEKDALIKEVKHSWKHLKKHLS